MTTTTADNPSVHDTPTTEKARRAAHEAVDAASEKASEFERKMRDESEKIGKKISEEREEITESVDETLEKVERYIRKEPVKAAGMAFAAGALAALLLRR
jgi:ElaB/YqjD/DUF883 family membrane-anchored ribosome-binding protein